MNRASRPRSRAAEDTGSPWRIPRTRARALGDSPCRSKKPSSSETPPGRPGSGAASALTPHPQTTTDGGHSVPGLQGEGRGGKSGNNAQRTRAAVGSVENQSSKPDRREREGGGMREGTPKTMRDARWTGSPRRREQCGNRRGGWNVLMKTWLSPRSRAIGERPRYRTSCGTIAFGRARGLLPAACKGSGGSSPTSGLRPTSPGCRRTPLIASFIRLRWSHSPPQGPQPCWPLACIRNGPIRTSSIHNLHT